MGKTGYNVMYWLSIGLALFGTFLGMTIVPVIWMAIAALYLVGGDIVEELRKSNGAVK